MRRLIVAAGLAVAGGLVAVAPTPARADGGSVGKYLAEGYEIKGFSVAADAYSSVLLQKGQTAVVCIVSNNRGRSEGCHVLQ